MSRIKNLLKKAGLLIMVAIIVASSVQWDAFATENPAHGNQVAEEIMLQETDAADADTAETAVPQADLSGGEEYAPGSAEYAEWKQNYLESDSISNIAADRAAGASNGGYIRNDIIEAYVDNKGLFTIGTVNGSDLPTDNNKILLFGHPAPWSSFTTVRIDNADYKFSGMTNRVETSDAIMVSHMIDKIVTTQSLAIVENEYTGKADTIAITYTMTNYDDSEHNVGLRIMMDTMLGSNDGAPFRVPGHGDVTTELELSGNSIPQNWLAFDRLDAPRVIANGCFYQTLDKSQIKCSLHHGKAFIKQIGIIPLTIVPGTN